MKKLYFTFVAAMMLLMTSAVAYADIADPTVVDIVCDTPVLSIVLIAAVIIIAAVVIIRKKRK